MPPTPIEERLRTLHAHYTSQVNAALAAGRFDLVQDLADACEDEALELMLSEEDVLPNAGEVEFLELGGWPDRPRRRPRSRWSRLWPVRRSR